MNRYIIILCLLFCAACMKMKRSEFKVVDWQYPSNLPRDTNLIGVWYEYKEYTTNGGDIERYLSKYIYNADGSQEAYSFDTVAKNFNTRDLCASLSGKRQVYWSTANNILTFYKLLRWRSEPDEPEVITRKYFFSQTKDTLYKGFMDESDEFIRNTGNRQLVRKMRPQ